MRVCVLCRAHYQKGSGITFHKFPTDLTLQLWLKNIKIDNWSPKANYHLCSKHFTDDCFIKHVSRTILKRGSVPRYFSGTASPLVTEQDKLHDNSCQGGKANEINFYTVSQSHTDPDITKSASTSLARYAMVTPTPCASGVKRRLSRISVDQKNASLDEPSTSGTQEKSMIVPQEFCENIKKDHRYENTQVRTIAEVFDNIKHDHRYEKRPRSSKKMLHRLKKSLKYSRARVKVLSQHVKRLKISVSCLKTVITDLKKKKLIGDDCANTL